MSRDEFLFYSTGSLKKVASYSVHKFGIDLTVLVAAISSAVDAYSLFLPWLVGISPIYVIGKGLTYNITAVLSAVDLLGDDPYLILTFLPPLLTAILVVLSIRDESIITPRVSYQTKSRILLFLAGVFSMSPAFAFTSSVMEGAFVTSRRGLDVSQWQLGGGATMPIYAGLGFFAALVLRIIKE